jgi:uncharacterized protein DUF4160/uncharacterized protein DUF2442
MPEISRFFGIIITMYFTDHPPPHFHVRYGSQRALVTIDPPSLLEGRLSPRTLGLVTEWAALHRDELLENWHLARQQQPLNRVTPLE